MPRAIELTIEQFEEASYFWDDWLRFMGFGREYNKLARMLRSMYETGVRFSEKWYYINQVIQNDIDYPHMYDEPKIGNIGE